MMTTLLRRAEIASSSNSVRTAARLLSITPISGRSGSAYCLGQPLGLRANRLDDTRGDPHPQRPAGSEAQAGLGVLRTGGIDTGQVGSQSWSMIA
jgi:hypothetical protein